MIVLSDGEILGDPMKLDDVLTMPQMEGITRFAIGVSILFTFDLSINYDKENTF